MDYKNCVCRNNLVDKLVEERTKIVDGNKIYNETLNTTSSNNSLSDCVSCTPFIVLFEVFLVISVIIGSFFVHFYWYSKKDIVRQYLKKNNVSIKPNSFKQQIIKLINGKY